MINDAKNLLSTKRKSSFLYFGATSAAYLLKTLFYVLGPKLNITFLSALLLRQVCQYHSMADVKFTSPRAEKRNT